MLLIFHFLLCATLWLRIPFCDAQIRGAHFIASISILFSLFGFEEHIYYLWRSFRSSSDDFQWKLRFRVNENCLFNFNETDYHILIHFQIEKERKNKMTEEIGLLFYPSIYNMNLWRTPFLNESSTGRLCKICEWKYEKCELIRIHVFMKWDSCCLFVKERRYETFNSANDQIE